MASGGIKSDQEVGNLVEQIKLLREKVDQLERFAFTAAAGGGLNTEFLNVGSPVAPTLTSGEIVAAGDINSEGDVNGVNADFSGSVSGGAADFTSEIVTGGSRVDGMIRSEGGGAAPGYSGDGIEVALLAGPEGRVIAYNRTTPGDIPLRLRGSAIYLDEGGTIVARVDGGDFYTVDFADYSGSSTTVGWSSFTEKEIYYKAIGDLVFVTFNLQGTSNSATTTFTVPYSSQNSTNYRTQFICRAENSGVWSHYPGMCSLPPNTNVVTCYLTNQAGAFSNTGGKSVLGQFFYQRA